MKRPDLMDGDVVLMKDNSLKRHDWPTGLFTRTFPSHDERVRQVEERVVKNGVPKLYLRPVSEVILLLQKNLSVEKFDMLEMPGEDCDGIRHFLFWSFFSSAVDWWTGGFLCNYSYKS